MILMAIKESPPNSKKLLSILMFSTLKNSSKTEANVFSNSVFGAI